MAPGAVQKALALLKNFRATRKPSSVLNVFFLDRRSGLNTHCIFLDRMLRVKDVKHVTFDVKQNLRGLPVSSILRDFLFRVQHVRGVQGYLFIAFFSTVCSELKIIVFSQR